MKKNILMMAAALACLYCFAEDYRMEKVAVFDNSEDSLPVREPWDVGEDGDATGNFICLSNDGELYIQNWDRYQLLKVSQKNYSLEVVHDLDFLQYGHTEHLSRIESGCYLFEDLGHLRSTMVDKDFNRKFLINNMKVNIPDFASAVYYDIDTDILFYEDKHWDLCSMVHPSCNLEQNKANVRNHEQTVSMLRNKTDVYTGNLTYTEEKGLYRGNEVIFVEGYVIGNNLYKKLGNTDFYMFIKNKKLVVSVKDETEAEEVESTAIHPCGDLYVLRYNQKTKLHTLYRIQNTWDASYRREWYKAHKGAF